MKALRMRYFFLHVDTNNNVGLLKHFISVTNNTKLGFSIIILDEFCNHGNITFVQSRINFIQDEQWLRPVQVKCQNEAQRTQSFFTPRK